MARDADTGQTFRDVVASDLFVPCPPGLATATEIASTPRADFNLELLALKLSPGKVVADQAIYDRVVRDVGAIRALQPAIATVGFFPPNDGRTILLAMTREISEQMQRGDYHDWDCLNTTYGASTPFDFVSAFDSVFGVAIKLKGTYSIALLDLEYGRLPGVKSAEPGVAGGDGPTICVTPGPTTWHYAFDAASGDCPGGCTEHHDWHFATEGDGTVTPLGSWNSQDGMPAPAWVAQYASRSVCR